MQISTENPSHTYVIPVENVSPSVGEKDEAKTTATTTLPIPPLTALMNS